MADMHAKNRVEAILIELREGTATEEQAVTMLCMLIDMERHPAAANRDYRINERVFEDAQHQERETR